MSLDFDAPDPAPDPCEHGCGARQAAGSLVVEGETVRVCHPCGARLSRGLGIDFVTDARVAPDPAVPVKGEGR